MGELTWSLVKFKMGVPTTMETGIRRMRYTYKYNRDEQFSFLNGYYSKNTPVGGSLEFNP